MDAAALREILLSEYEKLRIDEVVGLLEEELAKPSDEIDDRLLEICLDAIEEWNANPTEYIKLPYPGERRIKMNDEKNTALRDELFPDGMPEPEEFIAVMAQMIKKSMEEENKQ